MTNPVIATWTNDDGAFAEVALPEAKPNWDGTLTTWEVPLWDDLAKGMRSYPGSVSIRSSDSRISVECPSQLDTPDDARRLAAALLACAEAMDNGVRPLTASERVGQMRAAVVEKN